MQPLSLFPRLFKDTCRLSIRIGKKLLMLGHHLLHFLTCTLCFIKRTTNRMLTLL